MFVQTCNAVLSHLLAFSAQGQWHGGNNQIMHLAAKECGVESRIIFWVDLSVLSFWKGSKPFVVCLGTIPKACK